MIYKQICVTVIPHNLTFYVEEFDVELPGCYDYGETIYLKDEYTPGFKEQEIKKLKVLSQIQELIKKGYKEVKVEN